MSWFLHLPARVSILGDLRIDLLLVAFLSYLAVVKPAESNVVRTRTDTLLRILIVYAIITIPFVEWPGSVIKQGLPNLIKAVVFYYFTIAFIQTEKDLKKFFFVYLACQAIRILEPLYLHLTEGYWGSKASMQGGTEFLERLAGGPYDSVNPNGLAYLVCSILPFLYFMSDLSWKHRITLFILAPLSLYVLALTGSRSGIVGLGIVGLGILVKSRHRILLGLVFIIAAGIGFSFLSSDMQDRYLSLVGMGQKNLETAEQRSEGMEEQFFVVLHRPIFGHGLGTSPEANYHFTESGPYVGATLPAHNLYLEIGQELGLIGVVIFVLFIKSVFTSFAECRRVYQQQNTDGFLPRLISAMQVWMVMNFVFSFASYGLSSYDWYLFAGLSVILVRLSKSAENSVEPNVVLVQKY